MGAAEPLTTRLRPTEFASLRATFQPLAKIEQKLDQLVEQERDTRYSYAAGRPVFILDDPDGTPWVMQAYARIVDPDLGLDDLAGLGARLKLPAGWSYRTEALTSELVVHPVDGVARILQDDLENTYDACFETACEPNAP